MTTEIKSRSHDRIGLWMLVAVIVMTALLFFWTREHYQHNNPSLDTHVDNEGRLHVLGITLKQTTLKQAELILQSKSDIALYLYPLGHPKQGRKLEAFFPAIADHTKVVLLLDVHTKILDEIEARATIPHIYPNQVARLNLAAQDKISLNQAVVNKLTLIPNLTLTAAILRKRFGEPDQIQTNQEHEQYHYYAIGLQAQLNKDGPSSLHFSTPTDQNSLKPSTKPF